MKEFFKAILDFNLNRLFREKTTNIFIQFFRYIFVGGFAFWQTHLLCGYAKNG